MFTYFDLQWYQLSNMTALRTYLIMRDPTSTLVFYVCVVCMHALLTRCVYYDSYSIFIRTPITQTKFKLCIVQLSVKNSFYCSTGRVQRLLCQCLKLHIHQFTVFSIFVIGSRNGNVPLKIIIQVTHRLIYEIVKNASKTFYTKPTLKSKLKLPRRNKKKLLSVNISYQKLLTSV